MATLTFGIQVPSGIFIPSMVWGGLFGRILGMIVQQLQKSYSWLPIFAACHPDKECVTPGMYALLGSFSALGGVTRLTLSLSVIMFELTGTLNYVIPTMVCLTIAKLVGETHLILCFFGNQAKTQYR
jgi:chloride channel 3/4/5